MASFFWLMSVMRISHWLFSFSISYSRWSIWLLWFLDCDCEATDTSMVLSKLEEYFWNMLLEFRTLNPLKSSLFRLASFDLRLLTCYFNCMFSLHLWIYNLRIGSRPSLKKLCSVEKSSRRESIVIELITLWYCWMQPAMDSVSTSSTGSSMTAANSRL